MKLFVACLFALGIVFQFVPVESSAASPEGRLALVIGNANYGVAGALKNPVNDANDMEAQLARLGFAVTKLLDADKRDMEYAINAFGKKLLETGGIGLFYFAGHGVQVDGFNYLIPVGANVASEGDVKYFAVNAGWVLSKMQDAGNRLNMVFLDACRNNPFVRRFRSGLQGLAPMDAPEGTLVSFAAAPGGVAADGAGDNGVFTQNLLRYMNEPGLEVELMMKQVRAGVKKDTGGTQTPFSLSSLTGNFYFNPKTSSAGYSTVQPQTALPKESGASLDDFFESSQKNREAEARKLEAEAREREAKAKWEEWQRARDDEYAKVQRIDSDAYLAASEKAEAWRIFSDAASQENPYSERDDQMRAYAESQVRHWRAEADRARKVSSSTMVASANVSTNLREIAREGNFVAYENGVVLDTKTKLMWAAKDNGEDINWHDAKKYCENFRGGGFTDWRMPTQDELAGLYDPNKENQYGASVSDLIKITNWYAWAAETKDGGSSAAGFYFYDGLRDWVAPSSSSLPPRFAGSRWQLIIWSFGNLII